MIITGNEKAWIAFFGALVTLLSTQLPVTGRWHEFIGGFAAAVTGIITYLTRNTPVDVPDKGADE